MYRELERVPQIIPRLESSKLSGRFLVHFLDPRVNFKKNIDKTSPVLLLDGQRVFVQLCPINNERFESHPRRQLLS